MRHTVSIRVHSLDLHSRSLHYLTPLVELLAHLLQRELQIADRCAATVERARELGINRIIPAHENSAVPAPLGFIVTGMGGPYLQHVLNDIGLHGVFPAEQGEREIAHRPEVGVEHKRGMR